MDATIDKNIQSFQQDVDKAQTEIKSFVDENFNPKFDSRKLSDFIVKPKTEICNRRDKLRQKLDERKKLRSKKVEEAQTLLSNSKGLSTDVLDFVKVNILNESHLKMSIRGRHNWIGIGSGSDRFSPKKFRCAEIDPW